MADLGRSSASGEGVRYWYNDEINAPTIRLPDRGGGRGHDTAPVKADLLPPGQ